MSESLGSGGTFEVSTDGVPSSYIAVGEITDVAFDQNVNPVDGTSKDDSGNKTYLAGDFDGTATATFNYDPADAGQAIVLTNFYSKTTLYWRHRATVGSGEPQYVFQGIITAHPVPSVHETVIAVACAIQITGGVTKSTQT